MALRLRRLVVLVLAVLSFLPLANWIPGGHSAPWYGTGLSLWILGTVVVIGIGAVLAILSRSFSLFWRPGFADSAILAWERHDRLGPLTIAALAGGLYCHVALAVLGPRPLLIDEIIQTYQARIFAAGHLWLPQPRWPEFTSSMHLIDWGGKVYGQFPAGGPGFAALTSLLGAEWALGPIAAVLSVVFFAYLVRRIAPSAGVSLGATLLFALAPFVMFMSGSRMTHVTVLTALLGAALALAIVTESVVARPGVAFFAGLGLGIAATIRPVDALAFALPAALWLLLRAVRDPARWRDAWAAGAGVALPLAALMWVNLQTTGAPLRFGYTVMWGLSQTLGFHAAPNGEPHTPIRGLELINLYLLRLQTYLFETPVPSLLPACLALWWMRSTAAMERYLGASALLLLLLYAAYWHDGFYLGPRLVFPLVPVLAYWTARAYSTGREQLGSTLLWRGLVWASLAALALTVGTAIPARARQYGRGLATMRWDPDSAASAAKVHGALVLVRESWGAQLLARLWSLGISRSEAETLYASLDQCELETAVAQVEAGRTDTTAMLVTLHQAMAQPIRTIAATDSPDPSARYRPGTFYSPRCLSRRHEDQLGFTLYPPLLLADSGNLYLRDLHARDSLIMAAHPGRPLYLLKPAGPDEGAPPLFYPVSRDSLAASWAAEKLAAVP